jgi:hypothetical protein
MAFQKTKKKKTFQAVANLSASEQVKAYVHLRARAVL